MKDAPHMPDALWEKYSGDGYMVEDEFLAALREYGQAVRKRDAEICRKNAEFFGNAADSELHPLHVRERETYINCAAAIEQEKLP